MTELFLKLFSSKGLSAAEIEKLADEFAGMAFLYILGAAEAKLSEEDMKQIGELLDANRPVGALELVRTKYSPEEWEAMLKREIDPLVGSYMKEVVRK